jgi:hypothetical protein
MDFRIETKGLDVMVVVVKKGKMKVGLSSYLSVE